MGNAFEFWATYWDAAFKTQAYAWAEAAFVMQCASEQPCETPQTADMGLERLDEGDVVMTAWPHPVALAA